MSSRLPCRRAPNGSFGLRTPVAADYVMPPIRLIGLAVFVPSGTRALESLR